MVQRDKNRPRMRPVCVCVFVCVSGGIYIYVCVFVYVCEFVYVPIDIRLTILQKWCNDDKTPYDVISTVYFSLSTPEIPLPYIPTDRETDRETDRQTHTRARAQRDR